jgi:hypothetical protein
MGSTPLRLQVDIEEQQAADAEYASWIEQLVIDREDCCPNGRLHDYKPTHASSNYAWYCTRCGHQSVYAF